MIKFQELIFFQKKIFEIKSLKKLLVDNLLDFKIEKNFIIKNVSALENIYSDLFFYDRFFDQKYTKKFMYNH